MSGSGGIDQMAGNGEADRLRGGGRHVLRGGDGRDPIADVEPGADILTFEGRDRERCVTINGGGGTRVASGDTVIILPDVTRASPYRGLIPAPARVGLERGGNFPPEGPRMAYAHSDKLPARGSGDMPMQMRAPEQREKLEGGVAFRMQTPFQPAGDQPTAIAELVAGVKEGERDQVLLGATGTGKTFTMAKIIEETQRPAIILAPNKTLAAQLYGEFKGFFPDNAVEYFVSYYDYYQPEAYVPRSDTYIEKESQINEQIDRMRHSATRALLERDDVIIVASVSCIYGIGSVETYSAMTQDLHVGRRYDQRTVMADLVAQQYRRNDAGFARGAFRVRGDVVEIFPAHLEDRAWRLNFFGDDLEAITEFDPLTGKKTGEMDRVRIYANSHYVTPKPTMKQAMGGIRAELKLRLDQLVGEGKLLEAQRLEQRTNFDLEMLEATGVCNGIENYSRYLTGRAPGEPPPTLFEFIPDDAIVFADESHVSVPQIGAMYKGDYRRKFTLAEHGFRLPSCMDNRPLKFEEWNAMRPQSVYVSATPAAWELEQSGGVFAEQVIRPTGLLDPQVEIRPVEMQVDDLLDEIRRVTQAGYRTLVTTLTKRMAEDLTEYLHEQGIRVRYMHSATSTRSSGSRSCATFASAPSTCSSASTCCARGSTSPNAASSRSWTPTRRGSCAPRPPSCRPSAAPRATPTAVSSCTPTPSPGRWSAPCARPTAAAPSRKPTMRRTASRPRRSARTWTTSSPASTPPTPTSPASPRRSTSPWSAPTSRPTSTASATPCARPPRTSSSRKPPASATRSSASRPWTWPSAATPRCGSPPSTRRWRTPARRRAAARRGVGGSAGGT